jgi:2-keto-4-pentenoate hydratase/2-oxohepta-3-ene-1,7-dioic acid hydratase in catechol pathway
VESYLSLLSPTPAFPSKIVGIGRSYRDHALELDNPVPDEPLLFLKAPSALLAPGGVVELPEESERVDFEGEFALVIARRISKIQPEAALGAVLGVTLACDVTARDLQKRDRTFTRGKCMDTFCPIGPRLQTDPVWDELELRTSVNGEVRQKGRASDLLWGFDELVSYVSRYMTLEPGDLILTGTPAGVGPLAEGDQVVVSSLQIGTLRFGVEAAA